MQAGNGHLFEGYDDRMLSSSTLTVYSSAKGDRWPADDDPSDLESFVSAADVCLLVYMFYAAGCSRLRSSYWSRFSKMYCKIIAKESNFETYTAMELRIGRRTATDRLL